MFWCKLGALLFVFKRPGCWNALIPCNDDIETLVTSETQTTFQVVKCILTRYFKSVKCIHIYMQSVQEFFTDLKSLDSKILCIHLENNSFLSTRSLVSSAYLPFKCTLLHTINWCWTFIVSVIFYYKLPQVLSFSALAGGWVPCQFLSWNR